MPTSLSSHFGTQLLGDIFYPIVQLGQFDAHITPLSFYPLLLDHLTTSLALSSHLDPIRTSLTSLSASLERLQVKIHEPHVQLALLVTRLPVSPGRPSSPTRPRRF
jgi:hypothetical protein